MSEKIVTILGIGATVVSLGAALVLNLVGDKKMDFKIAEAVSKAIPKE